MAIPEGFSNGVHANGSHANVTKPVEEYDLIVIGGEQTPFLHTFWRIPGHQRIAVDPSGADFFSGTHRSSICAARATTRYQRLCA